MPMTEKGMTRQQLESYLWGAANILRGLPGLIAHAEPGSETEQLALEVAAWGKHIVHIEEA